MTQNVSDEVGELCAVASPRTQLGAGLGEYDHLDARVSTLMCVVAPELGIRLIRFFLRLVINPVGVEKVGQQKVFLPAKVPDRVCFLRPLSGN